MNKKLLLSLGSLSTLAVVAPILATVSCASEAPVDATNLIITAKTSPVLTTEEETTLKGTGTNTDKWAVLAKLFTGAGFVETNKDKFTVAVGTDNKVTLTAIKGYKINGGETVVSNAYTIGTTPPATTDLDIKALGAAATVTQAQLNNLNSATETDKLAALKLFFDGKDLTEANFPNFTVEIDFAGAVIKLTASKDFTIGTKTEVNSSTFTVSDKNLNFAVTTTATPSLTAAENTALVTPTSANLADQKTGLAKLFTGITDANWNFFTFTVNDTAKTVTLTAKKGFVIGAANTATDTTLVSKTFTVA
ncbi:MAG: hypothetical protein ACRDAW_01965 [Metamycoplasmataceae bacterium]